MTKHKRWRQQPGPIELVLIPDPVPPPTQEFHKPTAEEHLQALAQRASLQGRRIIPGMPNVRNVKVPTMLPGGEVMWRDV